MRGPARLFNERSIMKTTLLLLVLSTLFFRLAPAFAADTTAAAPQTPDAVVESSAPEPVQPHNRSTGYVALLTLAVVLAVALYFWSRKIRREGYHKTNTSYPSEMALKDKRDDTGIFKTPVP